MDSAKPAPRVFCMLAREVPIGVIVRRGPSREVCVLRWNLRNDEIRVGQWLKGRIYERRGDISPNGQYWLYMAMKGGKAFSAIAIVPYLKAKVFCSHSTTYEGGGLFTGNDTFWPWGWSDPVKELEAGFKRTTELPKGESPSYAANFTSDAFRLYRSGWVEVETQVQRGRCFLKQLEKGWTLRKWVTHGGENKALSGSEHEEHQLVSERGHSIDGTTWEWADWDRFGNRLVWAQEGKLYGVRVKVGGLAPPTEIYDFSPLQFTAIEAPY